MHNLAHTYSALGRYADALAIGEQVLEFRRRVLPANHPDTGACANVAVAMACDLMRYAPGCAMGNLANTYCALGRLQEAVVLQEKTLEFRRRVLSDNDPDIGGIRLCLVMQPVI